jgi:hypothetical protein
LAREGGLNAKGYSEKDERSILDALGRGLLKEFPNPDRAGCPGSDVLTRIASHEMPLPEAEKWLDHLTSCSPCYSDFSKLQAAYQHRRTRTLLAIAASILIVVCLAGWAFFLRHNESLLAQVAVLDLRNRSAPRGTEATTPEPSLEVSRAATHWDIYLPLGSSEGTYYVRVVAPSDEQLMMTSGTAKLIDGVTLLKVTANLSSAASGRYILQIRRSDSKWNLYQVVLR